MKMLGQERLGAPRARVWEALNDPEVLRQCIPGCQMVERDGINRLRAILEIKIGPIGARFNSIVTLSDVQPSQGYTLTGEGQGGTVGSAKAVIKVRLEERGSDTVLFYEVDAQVGGRLAQLGGPLIDATAKRLATTFFKRLGELVAATGGAPSDAQQVPVSTQRAPTAVHEHEPRSRGAPAIAWVLAVVIAALAGFLAGRGLDGANGSDWMGLAIGLLIVIVAGAGFEYGRRSATSQVVVDEALLRRLLRGEAP